ncbi:MAG: hypothetical protein ACFFBP_12435 [Promethearchaeota archaeon]
MRKTLIAIILILVALSLVTFGIVLGQYSMFFNLYSQMNGMF